MSAPQLVYHAAPECAYESVRDLGLLPDFMGLVYAAPSPEEAMSIMALRLMHHVHGTREVTLPDGELVEVPDVVVHRIAHVWHVDTSATAPWAESSDHSAEFFGDSSALVHEGAVPPEALVAVTTFSLGRRDDDA